MEKKISFGKIDFNHCGRKINELVVEVELRERGGEKTFRYINGQREFTGESTPAYIEFSACAAVWNSKHTDWIAGGQCFKDLLPYLGQLTKEKRLLFWRIYDLWIMDKIQVTRVNPENYVCEHLINELSNEINKNILENILQSK